MAKNIVRVEYKDGDGNTKAIIVKRPTSKQMDDAFIMSAKVFAKLMGSKDDNGRPTAVTRNVLDNYMRDVGAWSDKQEEELKSLAKEIDSLISKLKSGGMSLSKGREVALNIRKKRLEYTLLSSKKRELDAFTIEGRAENAKFDYLITVCLLDENSGEPVFESIEDYNANSDKDYVVEAASEFANMLYGLDKDWEKKLPENEFLLKYGFMDDKFRLIDRNTKRFVNFDGKFVNDNGELVDEDGRRVYEDGTLIPEFTPFTDDNGVLLDS